MYWYNNGQTDVYYYTCNFYKCRLLYMYIVDVLSRDQLVMTSVG